MEDGRNGPGGGPGASPATSPGGPRGVEEQARGARDTARGKAAEVKAQATAKAEELKEEAKAEARHVRDDAERRASRWTSEAGHRAQSLGRALHAASDSLRNEGETSLADAAGQAAERVERISGYLEEENPSAMVHDLEEIGRSNPAAFLGSAFTIGLMAGRFLRASRPQDGDGSNLPVPTSGEGATTTSRTAGGAYESGGYSSPTGSSTSRTNAGSRETAADAGTRPLDEREKTLGGVDTVRVQPGGER